MYGIAAAIMVGSPTIIAAAIQDTQQIVIFRDCNSQLRATANKCILSSLMGLIPLFTTEEHARTEGNYSAKSRCASSLCILCALCGEKSGLFTTEITENTEMGKRSSL